MIHQCTGDCRHHGVPDLGGFIVTRPLAVDGADIDRIEAERFLWDTFFGETAEAVVPIRRIDYLGALGPDDSRMHTWRVGGKKWRGVRGPDRTAAEGDKAKREIKAEYRPEVWIGSGLPVPPVDFSRPAEPAPEPFPAPVLTSRDVPVALPAKPARDLLAYAHSLGWEGGITQAAGHVPHSTHGRPLVGVKASDAVRLQRGLRRAVAVRMDGKWASMWTWSPDQFFTRHPLLDDFKGALA